MNDDTLSTAKDKWFPWIAVGPDGIVHIVFYDSRVDTVGNSLTAVYIASSSDGGTTFVNRRVSDVAFTPTNVNGIGGSYMGDYIGVAASRGMAYPCWNDNRIVVYQAYMAAVSSCALVAPVCTSTYDAGPHRITLRWADASDFEDEYVVEQKAGGDTLLWRTVAVLPANSIYWTTVGDFVGSETYTYRVRANWAGGGQICDPGPAIAVKIPPNAPSCVSGYCIKVNPEPVVPEWKTRCPGNSSDCGGGQTGGGEEGDLSMPDRGEMEMNALAPPIPIEECVLSNAYVIEWTAPENQLAGSVQGYKVVHRTNPPDDPGNYGYGHTGPFTGLADTICFPQPLLAPLDLSVLTVDADGDTSAFGGFTNVTIGNFDYCGWLPAGNGIPKLAAGGASAPKGSFHLGPNFPNPFNPSTVIRYSLPEDGLSVIDVYDILGRQVRRLVEEFQSAGSHDISWDGRDAHGQAVSSGMYFYRLTSGRFTESRKMVLLK